KMLFQAKKYNESVAQYMTKKEKCGKLGSVEVYYLGRAYLSAGDSLNADSTFAEFIARNPTSPDGYYWRAFTNVRYQILKAEDFPAFPYYQKYIELTSTDPAKYKRNLSEAYTYSGVYYFEKAKDKEQAKANFMKALELNPEDEIATEFMKQF
ncbi:MAG TPA: tetratricopeptide repeat protein, partial [Chitinophagales bacterium]|nr:tetratricopeptide repeat protein [Chitinophagales bacterium]